MIANIRKRNSAEIQLPLNLSKKAYHNNKYAYYKYLREHEPVHKGKFSLLDAYFVSRYEDCVSLLKDPRIVRNRATATGGRNYPIPLPKSAAILIEGLINQDDPEHRRLRNLVHKAFTPRRIKHLSQRIDTLTHELLDKIEAQGHADLRADYALPIPVAVISEMVGIEEDQMPQFMALIDTIVNGLSGWRVLKSFVWDLPKVSHFVRDIVVRKRANLQDDILSGLIEAEENGGKLSEDELVTMVYTLVMAGYETTVDLITNAVQTLLTHPDALQQLRSDPTLFDSAIEEVLRFNAPIHTPELQYASEPITLHGVTIPKGAIVMPLLAAANHDPTVFENPETFDITRTPNRHLGFGMGVHYCLGAPLARIETKYALTNLLERNPNLRLAVGPDELELQLIPMFHRYKRLPVHL